MSRPPVLATLAAGAALGLLLSGCVLSGMPPTLEELACARWVAHSGIACGACSCDGSLCTAEGGCAEHALIPLVCDAERCSLDAAHVTPAAAAAHAYH